jgi:hypothetical protein
MLGMYKCRQPGVPLDHAHADRVGGGNGQPDLLEQQGQVHAAPSFCLELEWSRSGIADIHCQPGGHQQEIMAVCYRCKGLNLSLLQAHLAYQNVCPAYPTYLVLLHFERNELWRHRSSTCPPCCVNLPHSFCKCWLFVDRRSVICGAMAPPSYAHSCNATTAAWLALVCLAAQAAQATDQCDGPVSTYCCVWRCSWPICAGCTCASSKLLQQHNPHTLLMERAWSTYPDTVYAL